MLEKLLAEKRAVFLDRWVELVLETYPAEASRFFREEKDPFANPVGATVRGSLEGLWDEIVHGKPAEGVSPWLDNLVRVRALQDFTPSQAIAFIFLLKRVVREGLSKELRKNRLEPELIELEAGIDRLALLAFDQYMQCREQIFNIRIKEVKAGLESALRFAGRSSSRQVDDKG